MRPLASQIENTIWPRLHPLMGRQPLSDAGVSCFHGIDDKLDIYMLHGKLAAYPCGILIYGNIPLETFTQTVPLAKLLSKDPQTFTLAGSAPLQHVTPAGASLENDCNFSLTVQRR